MTTEINQEKKSKLQKLKGYFTLFEIIWFVSLTIATIIVSIFLPEEAQNGISGTILTILYVLDVVIAIFCELLTSKQSKWSLMLYNIVELIEIVTLILIKARFASLAVSIFFWIPMHTIGFFHWEKHPDKKQKELTQVRSLKWWQTMLIILACSAWTAAIGYLTSTYGSESDIYNGSEFLKMASSYLDACCSFCSIANGILLLFRFKENWIVWFIYTLIETIINIILGQWVLILLKVGYFTNNIYGYLKWTKYIKEKQNDTSNPQKLQNSSTNSAE